MIFSHCGHFTFLPAKFAMALRTLLQAMQRKAIRGVGGSSTSSIGVSRIGSSIQSLAARRCRALNHKRMPIITANVRPITMDSTIGTQLNEPGLGWLLGGGLNAAYAAEVKNSGHNIPKTGAGATRIIMIQMSPTVLAMLALLNLTGYSGTTCPSGNVTVSRARI
jgi:hypothetical protein